MLLCYERRRKCTSRVALLSVLPNDEDKCRIFTIETHEVNVMLFD